VTSSKESKQNDFLNKASPEAYSTFTDLKEMNIWFGLFWRIINAIGETVGETSKRNRIDVLLKESFDFFSFRVDQQV